MLLDEVKYAEKKMLFYKLIQKFDTKKILTTIAAVSDVPIDALYMPSANTISKWIFPSRKKVFVQKETLLCEQNNKTRIKEIIFIIINDCRQRFRKECMRFLKNFVTASSNIKHSFFPRM